jgi:hypothetical protein
VASFADRLEKRLDSLIERAAKMLILEINRELKRETPVDTGHARANWIPSVGEANVAEAPGVDHSLAQRGTAEVLGYKLERGKLYLTNVVPYVRRLNDGWSDQAPALFVEASIARAMATVKSRTGVDFGLSEHVSESGAGGAENLADAFSPFN